MAFLEDIYFAIDNSVVTPPAGNGTSTDPFRGPDADTSNWFDGTITNLGANRTVRLGPGKFVIRGLHSGGTGWKV